MEPGESYYRSLRRFRKKFNKTKDTYLEVGNIVIKATTTSNLIEESTIYAIGLKTDRVYKLHLIALSSMAIYP